MATYGNIAAFDSSLETWAQYVERVQHFFEANDIQEGKKKSIFLTLVGPVVYKLLRSLIAPSTTEQKSLDSILQVLNDHYSPVPSEIVERFRFNSRIRKSGESISTFVSELRRLSEYCNFGSTLDTMIRDRLVCGIQNADMQRRLLAESGLTLRRAVEIAVSMETAARDALDLQVSNNASASVYKAHVQEKEKGFPKNFKDCIRCGAKDHIPRNCPFRDKKCYKCGVSGHLSKKCLKGAKSTTKGPCNVVCAVKNPESGSSIIGDQVLPNTAFKECDEYDVFHNSTKRIVENSVLQIDNPFTSVPKPYAIVLKLDNIDVSMEIDTGCALSLINLKTYNMLNSPALRPANATLSTFTGQRISVRGTMVSMVGYKNKCEPLQLLVVEGEGPNLCGRNWIETLNILPVSNVYVTNVATGSVQAVLNDFKDVFSSELGHFKDAQINLILKPDVRPVFYKARTLPFAVRDKVGRELERLQDIGIIKSVRYSQWATPIVSVLKGDKVSIRICGDFKLTANTAIDADRYPLPKSEDIFASLAGGIQFSKLDLKDAYSQLELDEVSRKVTVVNTHLGLFEYTRLPYGISSAPAIFQRVMETLLKGISGTAVYLDDILITGRSVEDHLKNLREVLDRLRKSGFKLKPEKCEFLCNSLTFLGHVINRDGIRPVEEKIKAIKEAPAPRNVGELRSFLGLITFYSKFLPNMSTRLAPLYNLLQKSISWRWSREENSAFADAKNAICDTGLLVHFDPAKELTLACDASPYGVGAVLSHTISSEDCPIAFASRTLTPAEKNYSHLEKEALALIFGVVRFREYLIGRQFVLYTDHRPLVSLFSEKKHVPATANSRIQRWALTLSAYNYTVRYRSGTQNGNADACSRLPLPDVHADPPGPVELVLQMERVDLGPISVQEISRATLNDPILAEVSELIMSGWPENIGSTSGTTEVNKIMPYFKKRNELALENNIMLWGNRIVIPEKLRSEILSELHNTHQGVTGMKSIARSIFWWPNLDTDIEGWVQKCSVCIQHSNMPPKSLQPWPSANRPWSRIHIDYAGPIDNYMILVVQDAHSKWIEAIPVKNATSTVTLEKLYEIFARFGFPECIVSDNGTVFRSVEFETFVKRNGIRHLFTAPYHPSSNGQAERAVQFIKHRLKKVIGESISIRLSRILMNFRRTPLALQGISPAEILLGRQIRCRLDLVHSRPPKSEPTRNKEFNGGEEVYFRNYGKGDRWVPGTIEKPMGQKMYQVVHPSGAIAERHTDQLRVRHDRNSSISNSQVEAECDVSLRDNVSDSPQPKVTPATASSGGPEDSKLLPPPEQSELELPLRRSGRQRKPPLRLRDYYS